MPGQAKSKFQKRYYLLAGVVIALLAIIGVSYFVSRRGPDSNFAPPAAGGWKIYENRVLGFSLQYPDTWVLEAPDSATVIFSDPDGSGEATVSVTSQATADLIRESLGEVEESEIFLDGIKASKLLEHSGGSGNPLEIIMAAFNNRLYFLESSSPEFEKMVQTFKFIQEY